MKLLFENWRIFINEAMKQPTDLPDGVQVRIFDSGGDVGFKIVSAETGEQPSSQEMRDKFGRVFGHVWIRQYGEDDKSGKICADAWEVVRSEAVSGYGPMLYDLAMEYATKNGSGIMSDRSGVSEEAYFVWKKYMDSRDDVEKIQLDDYVNTLTPEKDDNCAQLSSIKWAEKTGGKWHHKPTSMVYRKNNTEMTDKVKQAGKFYPGSDV
jgi:hypothetical protein